MIRFLALMSAFLTLGSAFALYAIKYDTRRLEAQVQTDERSIERLEGDIAVLKAERAYLARPERIERLARAQGLRAIIEEQYMPLGSFGGSTADAERTAAKK
jgi:cell division protein FtsL